MIECNSEIHREMLDATDLRPGVVILLNGQPHLVISYNHRVLGRKKARVRIGVRNLRTGATLEKTSLSGTSFEEVELEERKLTYLYSDRKDSIFEDGDGKRVEVANDLIAKQRPFLIKEKEYLLLFWEDQPISLRLPKTMILEVVESPPGVKGNSAINLFKTVKLENGLEVKVPLFISEKDRLVIDTESEEYRERVK